MEELLKFIVLIFAFTALITIVITSKRDPPGSGSLSDQLSHQNFKL